jgi:hypothetical protein
MDALYNVDDSPWKSINKGSGGGREPFSTVELARHMFDYGVEPIQLRPYPGDNHTQRRGYPLAPLAEVWRRYLPPICLPSLEVTRVTASQREVLDAYFDWVAVDDEGKPVPKPCDGVTDVTPSEGAPVCEEPEAKAEAPEPDGGNQETAPNSGAPNFTDVLSRPFDDWSPFGAAKPKRRS